MVDLEGGEAEFIAALDADMIPEADWLRAIIAHMVIDDKMALVCPPQVCDFSILFSGIIRARELTTQPAFLQRSSK